MRHARAGRALSCVLAWLLLGCTHDFSSFTFSDQQPATDHTPISASDAATPVQPSDAGSQLFDGAADASAAPGAPDAQVAVPAVATPDAGESPSPSADAGHATPPADASLRAPDSDAGADRDAHVPTEAEQCVATWSDDQLSDLSCAQCACQQCTSPTLDCLSRGSADERALCTSLFACALDHGCHDWDCYCTTMSCRMGNGTPDGPCVAQMNAAAGGERERVLAVHQANDPNQPLVRAVRAIGCATGQSRTAVGGMMTAKCSVCGQ